MSHPLRRNAIVFPKDPPRFLGAKKIPERGLIIAQRVSKGPLDFSKDFGDGFFFRKVNPQLLGFQAQFLIRIYQTYVTHMKKDPKDAEHYLSIMKKNGQHLELVQKGDRLALRNSQLGIECFIPKKGEKCNPELKV